MSYRTIAASIYGDGRPNRIFDAIVKMRTNIDQRLASGAVTQETLDTLHKSLDMDVLEYCKFQETLGANETMTPEEAQFIYALLGNIPDTFNAQPLEVKCILTQVFKELLERKMARRAG